MSTAYINRTATVRDDLDTLTVVPFVTIPARSLKAGMILVDELDCPAAEIDHRIRSAKGAIEFLIHDFDNRSITTTRLTEHADIKVMAR